MLGNGSKQIDIKKDIMKNTNRINLISIIIVISIVVLYAIVTLFSRHPFKPDMNDITNRISNEVEDYNMDIEKIIGNEERVAIEISYNNEFKQFLYISLGSCAELETQIIIAQELGYIDSSQSNILVEDLEYICKMTSNFIKQL